jgi:hypothetical protein
MPGTSLFLEWAAVGTSSSVLTNALALWFMVTANDQLFGHYEQCFGTVHGRHYLHCSSIYIDTPDVTRNHWGVDARDHPAHRARA